MNYTPAHAAISATQLPGNCELQYTPHPLNPWIR